MQLGLIFSAAAQCKKAYDTFKNVRQVPEEAYFLWQLLDAIQPTFAIAAGLNSNEDTWSVVNKSLEVVHEVVVLCDVLLARADPDGRPTDADSWEGWWATSIPGQAKDNVTRVALIPKLTMKLQAALAALHASLSAATLIEQRLHFAAAGGGGHSRQKGKWNYTAAARARAIMHLFESDRLAAFGDQYQLGLGRLFRSSKGVSGAATTGGERVCLGDVCVILRRAVAPSKEKPSECVYELLFVNADDVARGIELQQGSGSALAAARLTTTTSKATPPKIEASVRLSNPEASIGVSRTYLRSSTTTSLHLRCGSDSFLLEYTSCVVPSQCCYFPSADETYHHVTSEVAQLLMVYTLAVGLQKKASQIDALLPVVPDVGNADFDSERDEREFSKFCSPYVPTSS